jgi:RpiB/LacA/LacB family sugar-phosphate isomerase
MEIAVGADHAGFVLKQDLAEFLRQSGHTVMDLGTFSTEPVDYPDYAEAVALAIREGRAARGILVCGSGVGASVAANKIPGIRACLCHDIFSAHQGVEDDSMNILVLGGRVIGTFLARDLVSAFLAAEFSGKERHRRRLEKIRLLEEKYGNRTEFSA